MNHEFTPIGSRSQCPTMEQLYAALLASESAAHVCTCDQCAARRQELQHLDEFLDDHAEEIFAGPPKLPTVRPLDPPARRPPNAGLLMHRWGRTTAAAGVLIAVLAIQVLVPPVSNPSEQNWRGVPAGLLEATVSFDEPRDLVVVSWLKVADADSYSVRFWAGDGSLIVDRSTTDLSVAFDRGRLARAGLPVAWSVEAVASGVRVASSSLRESFLGGR